jgi:hypothetical protein
VHVEELFLAEGLVAVAAGVRLLPGVGTLVHDHVPFLKQSHSRESPQGLDTELQPQLHVANDRPFSHKELTQHGLSR